MNSVKNLSDSHSSGRTVKDMAVTGLMAAVFCIAGPISIPLPFSPVPISLTSLALLFAVYLLGMKRGTLSYVIYLLAGLVGVPVFSGFTGGPGKLLGPTGGYLIGFIFMALICGFFVDRQNGRPLQCLPGLLLGTAVCYLFGTAWLAIQAGMSFSAALLAGVLPFIPGDLIKILIAMTAGPHIRSRLRKAGF